MGDDPTDPQADPDFDDSGVPIFESVRGKIESRYQTSIGAQELDLETLQATPEGRSVEKQYEDRQRAATDRLEQIRASMRDDKH